MYMPDPVIELLDLALETLTLNFDEFLLPDHQVSGLEVERLEVRITGIYNKITIIRGICHPKIPTCAAPRPAGGRSIHAQGPAV